jgi:hypothetical protein
MQGTAAAVLLLAVLGQAEATGAPPASIVDRPPPIVQEQSFDYLGPSGGRRVTFAQFDDLGGTRFLVDVGLELLDTSTSVFHLQAHNTAGVDNSVRIEMTSSVRAQAPSNLAMSLALSLACVSSTRTSIRPHRWSRRSGPTP